MDYPSPTAARPATPGDTPARHVDRSSWQGRLDVLVIGAGQAGLATAYHLRARGLRFLVVDAGREIGGSWRGRWDSLRLFTPAQHDSLPGMEFPAPADTYPTKDEVAGYLAAYAAKFELPVLLACRVQRLERTADGFVAHTRQGPLAARQVVVATGPFQSPMIPGVAADLPADVRQLHSAEYRRPDALPDGPVVVVGGANSGRQIALELAATREVTLAVGAKLPELPQRPFGRDLFWWLTRTRLIGKTADSRLARRMRARGDLVVGSPMRAVRRAGVTVRGRVVSAGPDSLRFETGSIRPATVVWATGFRSDYTWIDVPGVLEGGEVVHRRGISPEPGLCFVGLPWQHTRGSALLGFVGPDVEFIAEHLDSTASQPARPSSKISADANS
jgi:putative flavoprotein involved in K+ transport